MARRDLTPAPRPTVEYAEGAAESAFAQMLGGLIEANVERDANARRDFDRLRARVGVHATDLGESVTLHFQAGRLTVHCCLDGACDVTLHATSDALMSLAGVGVGPLRTPNYLGAAGRGIVGQALRGRLRVEGLAGNLTTLNRLTRLVSVR